MHITPMSLWFMVPITIVFMGFINHLITVGPHIVVANDPLRPRVWIGGPIGGVLQGFRMCTAKRHIILFTTKPHVGTVGYMEYVH